MKTVKFIFMTLLGGALLFNVSCNKDDDDPQTDPPTDPGSSTSELVVKQFSSAPNQDGVVDEMWGTAKRLVGTTSVPTNLGPRMTYLNPDGEGIEEELGLFHPYAGEEQDFTLRAGYNGDMIYFLMEWADDDDSMDRQSWYFDPADNKWKGEHKYANAADDKFYEDKFAFLFPIGDVAGFNAASCYATCHTASSISTPKDKHTRHYLSGTDEKIDMWHWKRVRGEFLGQVDDQKMVWADPALGSGANGRKGDGTGSGGYANNKQTLNNGSEDVDVPQYVIPGATDYHWITIDDVNNGTAKEITAVDENGVLTYDGGTIDPNGDPAYAQGSGNKRLPSVVISEFTEGRGDISIAYTYTGSGWIAEFSRKLNTGDEDDVIFVPGEDLAFGLATFDNAAIAHAIKAGLIMKWE